MPTVCIFNPETGRFERSFRSPSEPMPYNQGGTLTLREFSGSRDPLFSSRETMNAFNALRSAFGAPIRIVKAFLSADEDESSGCPHHFAGTALLMLPLSGTVEDLIRANKACGAFPVAEKQGSCLYADCRYLPYPPHITKGYPTLFIGSANHYVGFLQRALRAAGVFGGAIDGIFGSVTDKAVRAFQLKTHLAEDGIVSEDEWASLAAIADLP